MEMGKKERKWTSKEKIIEKKKVRLDFCTQNGYLQAQTIFHTISLMEKDKI